MKEVKQMLLETDRMVGNAPANTETPDENTAIAVFMSASARRDAGFTYQVDGEDNPRTIRTDVTNVHMGSAWMAFTVKNETFRTMTIADRNTFYAWYKNGGQEPFSKEEGHWLFGPPGVMFMKVGGLKT